MFRPKLFPVTILLLVLSCVAQGQTTQPAFSSTQSIQITGTLRYADGTPASDVVVRLDKFSGGFAGDARTDRLGKFRFVNLSPQQYHLTIRQPGFQEIVREVDLVFTGQEYLQLSLVPDRNQVGSRPPLAPSRVVLDASIPLEARQEFEKAEALLASQKKDAPALALTHLQKAIAIHPEFLEAQIRLGLTYSDLQQWDEAEKALRRAIEINPKAMTAYLALGEVYLRNKRLTDAEKIIIEGLTLDSRSWMAHFALGRVYYATGDLSKAGKQIGATIQLNSSFPDAHFVAANIYLRVNNREFAREQFQEYLKLAPKGEFAGQARAQIERLK
jgi:Tfp pilus assembly protein PilF